MKQISVRELRQQASVWLRAVEDGESFEVTDRGRPVAMLGPLPAPSRVDALVNSGRATAARGDVLDHWPPLPPKPGVPAPTEMLEQLRADER